MKTIGVFYSTRNGQTQRIADYSAAALQTLGYQTEVRNVADLNSPNLSMYAGLILAAPVYAGAHQRDMAQFVRRYRSELNMLPTAFLSVTLSQAGAERLSATPEQRARGRADAQRVLDEFFAKTGWQPTRSKCVAGSLLYSKYNFLLRFIMKRIARSAGGDTDTSRDYEYTDWKALDSFLQEFSGEISPPAGLREVS
jgi:menaquinone-dependent protoporphyrinogen oxidase